MIGRIWRVYPPRNSWSTSTHGGWCCRSKYRANVINPLFYFFFFNHFFYHPSCSKDQFIVFTIFFTDPGLLKIRRTLSGLSFWFCLHRCNDFNTSMIMYDQSTIWRTSSHIIKIFRTNRFSYTQFFILILSWWHSSVSTAKHLLDTGESVEKWFKYFIQSHLMT